MDRTQDLFVYHLFTHTLPLSHSSSPMGIFYTLNSFVVAWNLRLMLFSKIWLFLDLVKCIQKILKFVGFQIWAYFFYSFIGCWLSDSLAIFHYKKASKHNWEPSCHLLAKNSNWLTQFLFKTIILNKSIY